MDININTFNTINEVESYRNKINEACDARVNTIKLCEEANALSNKSFSYIKEAFEAIAPSLFKTNEGKSILTKYSNMIKNNKNLSSLHNICEGIRKVGKNSEIDFFANSLASTNWNVDKKTVKEDCYKLGRILAEGYLYLGNEAKALIPKDNIALDNAINFIAENKKSAKNIAEYSDAIKIIKENIQSKDETVNIFESIDIEDLAKNMLEEFNAKYSNELEADEIKVLKEISNSSDRAEIFNKYKKDCLAKLSEAKENYITSKNNSAVERISTVMEKVENKAYKLETIGEDVCGFIELANIFD